MHEVQQRTDKVQCQRCCSHIEAGFQVCPRGGKLNMSEEMLSRIRQTFMQTQCRRLHDVPKYARSQARCSAMAEASFPCQRVYEKDQQKKRFLRRFLTASRMMKCFMQASYNITGQKNGANIWTTLKQSKLRTMTLQNSWNDTQRCIIFGTINADHCQHEQRSSSESTDYIKEKQNVAMI